ncbi:MAG: hypothetical protein PHW07_04375 [Sulfurospirillaceae bacterium]|nr:hypothetical protein [Sulfurospirillaceae bacterium]
MIWALGKLNKVINSGSSSGNLQQFNANLPIGISVLKQIDPLRYKLLFGKREITTKSQKRLEVGGHYWGEFGEGKEGVLLISNLEKKPDIFDDDAHFLDLEFELFEDIFKTKEQPIQLFKSFILSKMAESTTNQNAFMVCENILLSLNKSIISLPLLQDGRKTLFQFHIDSQSVVFYMAFENLGPVEGIISFENDIFKTTLAVKFEKTLFWMKKELKNLNIDSSLSLKSKICPLYEIKKALLDVKG